MAVITRTILTTGPYDSVTVQVVYDDRDNKLDAVQIANRSGYVYRLFALHQAAGDVFERDCLPEPAPQPTVITVPAGQANRYDLVLRPDGRIDGLHWELRAL